MSGQDLFYVGARLLGVYFFALGLSSIPGIATAYDAALNTSPSNAGAYTISVAAQVALLLAIGAALLLRYRVADSHSIDFSVTGNALKVGLQLLGLSFGINGLIGIVSWVGQAALVSSWSFALSHLVSSALYAVIGASILFRASPIAALLTPPVAA